MIEQKVTENIKLENNDLEILKKNFWHCFDKIGNFDFNKFKEQLSQKEINFSKESYSMDWLGKSYARLLASDNAKTSLKEDEEWNKKNTNSKNLLLKWDNLEVLKHLSNAYTQKVKMIYIDPPYNTWSDGFVYQDDRKFSVSEFRQLSWVSEDKAKNILNFVDSKSNSHSAWLTFMYPRLYIAKQLLKDDWVIFISIDDNEIAQLRLLMDEIFGEENFVAQFVWTGKSGSEDDSHIRNNKEYILSYSKHKDNFNVWLDIKKEEKFIYFDKNKKDFYKRQLLRKWWDNSKREDRPNLYYSILDSKNNNFFPTLPNWEDGCWRWWRETMWKAIIEWKVEFVQNGKYEAYEKIFKSEERNKTKKFKSLLTELWSSSEWTKEIKKLFNDLKIFSNPKPTKLLIEILKISNTQKDDLILDFFSGSGTSGDAVMQLNSEDDGDRKFVLVQIPEEIDEKKSRTSFDFVKDELWIEKPSIFDITKERLIRAGEKIKKDNLEKIESEKDDEKKNKLIEKNKKLDLWFKIFETCDILIPEFEEEEFSEKIKLFDESALTKNDLKNLLVTWKTYDGIPLTQNLEEKNIDGYTWYYWENKLYLVDNWFKTKNLAKLLNEIDENNNFNPNIIIAFWYNFESKMLRELSENIKNYANKKHTEIDFISRY